MSNLNLFSALRAAFPADLDAIAVETADAGGPGLCYSWRDLDRATAMMANLLTSLKLPAGSRVAVQVEKSFEAVMLYLATLRAGYVFLPLNTAYTPSELLYFVSNAGARLLVADPRTSGPLEPVASEAGAALLTLSAEGIGTFAALAANQPTTFPTHPRGPSDLAALLYTSGTTGRSKGAMMSHRALLAEYTSTLLATDIVIL